MKWANFRLAPKVTISQENCRNLYTAGPGEKHTVYKFTDRWGGLSRLADPGRPCSDGLFLSGQGEVLKIQPLILPRINVTITLLVEFNR
jgi:hypothetical protein